MYALASTVKVTKKSSELLDIVIPYTSNMITFLSVKWVPITTASRGNEVGKYKLKEEWGGQVLQTSIWSWKLASDVSLFIYIILTLYAHASTVKVKCFIGLINIISRKEV